MRGPPRLPENPLALVRALETLEAMGQKVPIHGNPAFSAMFIVNPLSKEGMMTLFMTHPSTDDRIQRLKAIAEKALADSPGTQVLSPST
jgi:heat shock protein HtpX